MKPIIIVMLCVDAAMFLVTILTALKARPRPGRPRPVWSSLAVSLLITASVSFQIADKHRGSDGGELLEYCSGVLLGMAIFSVLALLRQKMGTDAAG
ncbi:MAG TPA: hypothetical protein VGF77_13140 [Allosphingosinicella sp.]|jgi:hypothetical protein